MVFYMTVNANQPVSEVEAIAAMTALGYCGDIAFLSCIVNEAKPAFKKKVESAMMLAMEVGISLGWTNCTDNEFVWTGHEPIRRVLESDCSGFCKEHAREIIEKYYGTDAKRVYLPAIPSILPDLEAERSKNLPNIGKCREILSLYLKQESKETARAAMPKLQSQPPSANGKAQKKQTC